MDRIDIAKKLYSKTEKSMLSDTDISTNAFSNVTAISGTAIGDSTDGKVEVEIDGNIVEVDTILSVKEGDDLIISIVNHIPTVSGIIGWGDQIDEDLSTVSENTAEVNQRYLDLSDTIYGSDGLSQKFEQLNANIDAWMHIDNGLVIGNDTVPVKIVLGNGMLAFVQNNEPIAWFTGNKLFVPNAQMTNSLQLGDVNPDNPVDNTPLWEWKTTSTGNLSLKYVGD